MSVPRAVLVALRASLLGLRGGCGWARSCIGRFRSGRGTRADKPVEVRLSCATDGGTIADTTDAGESPRWLLYSRPFRLSTTIELRVKCARLGSRDSAERRVTFTLAR